MSVYKSWCTTTKVFFRIDHQTFEVNYHPVVDRDDPDVKYNPARRRWYVKQLTTALKRLAESGKKKKKANGSKSRTTKKPKANEAVKRR